MSETAAKSGRAFLKWGAIGALLFWIPDVIDHALLGYRFDTKDVRLVMLLCPLVVLVGYFILAYCSDEAFSVKQPASMLLGIWCFGGFATMLASSFGGGGFMAADGPLGAVELSVVGLVLPPLTFMLATYDGTLFALIGITALLCAEMGMQSASALQRRHLKPIS
jgi:hypothetical protein